MKRPENGHCPAGTAANTASEREPVARAGAVSLEEWQTRYASRVMERAGWSKPGATAVAKAAATLQCGEADSDRWDAPEDAADEVMSSWEHAHG